MKKISSKNEISKGNRRILKDIIQSTRKVIKRKWRTYPNYYNDRHLNQKMSAHMWMWTWREDTKCFLFWGLRVKRRPSGSISQVVRRQGREQRRIRVQTIMKLNKNPQFFKKKNKVLSTVTVTGLVPTGVVFIKYSASSSWKN